MSDLHKKFGKNFLILFTGNSVGQVIPFLLAPLITRLYSPSELGVQENFLAIVSLVAIIAAGRFDLALVLPGQKAEAVQLFRIGFLITLIVSVLMLLPGFFPASIDAVYHSKELSDLAWFLGPSVFLVSVLSLLNNWTIRLGNYPLLTGNRIAQSLVQNGLYAILGYAGWGIHGLIIAWMSGVLVPILMLGIPARKSLHLNAEPLPPGLPLIRRYRDFPLINSLHAFTDILATQFLIYWLITREYGVLSLGLFAITNRYLRAPLNLVSSAVSQLYYKDASAAIGQAENQYLIFKRSLRLTLFIIAPVILLVMLAGPWLFETYLGNNWKESGIIARIMAPAIFFNFLASVVSTTPLVFNSQKKAFLLNLMGYALSLGVLFIGSILKFPFHETLIAYSFVLSVYYLGILFWYKQLIRNSLA